MDKLKHLLSLCKASVHLTVNEHQGDYIPIVEWIASHRDEWDEENVPPEVMQKMIELDTIVDVHAYADTPVGFYKIIH